MSTYLLDGTRREDPVPEAVALAALAALLPGVPENGTIRTA